MKNTDITESASSDFERQSTIASRVMQEKIHLCEEYTDHTDDALYKSDKSEKTTSGISMLDGLLGEFRQGGLYAIGGRPGMGKTALMLDIVLNISHSSCMPIYFITLDLSKEQLAIRLLQKLTGIPFSILKSSESINERDRYLIEKYLSAMDKMNVFICDKAVPGISDLERVIESNIHEGIVFIDFFELIGDKCREINGLDKIALCLKRLAKNRRVPIVVAAQMSRQAEKRVDKRPHLTDLVGCVGASGREALAQESDGIILIYRDDYYGRENSKLAELNLVKNTFGKTGLAVVHYDSKSDSFI